LLKKYQDSTHPKFILTESVFGMDGDIADLEKIVALAKDHSAFLYVDEAHATGLFGEKGYGLTCQFGKEIDVSMGTFSKGLGGAGAYVATSKDLQQFLLNRCAGFIYSTAPSFCQISAMQSAWQIVPTLQNEVNKLFTRAKDLRDVLQNKGLQIGNSTSHIIPVILEEPQKVLAMQEHLAANGIRVGAIRPPAVPPQQSRLRICLTLKHTQEDIGTLTEALVSAFNINCS
jgi:8-amino-7-oxononanoate synthase